MKRALPGLLACLAFACVKTPAPASGGPPRLATNPTRLAFAGVPVGQSGAQNLELVNFGGTSLTVTAVTATVAGVKLAPGSLPRTLAPGDATRLSVEFAPTVAGAFSGELDLASDAEGSPTAVPLTAVTGVSGGDGGLPAFPGASGGGAASVGGRGGAVVLVSNLNDSGPGSLRACVEGSGPRTCVFTVAGVIDVQSRLHATNPFLTVAGQTAPAGGITLHWVGGSDSLFFITGNDFIVRYLTMRIGTHSPAHASCVEVANGDNRNIILDHLSLSWWDGSALVMVHNYVGPNRLLTVQNSLFAEASASSPVGIGMGGALAVSNQETDLDFHHNLFSDIGSAIPDMSNRSLRWMNNIVYDWSISATTLAGGIQADVIGNLYKAGPLAPTPAVHEIDASDAGNPENPGPPSLFLAGNVGPDLPDGGNQWLLTAQTPTDGAAESGAPAPALWARATQLPTEPFPIPTDAVATLEATLLPTVGNSRRLDCAGNWVPNRDAVDARLVAEYQAGMGQLFTTEDANHTIPAIDAGTACPSASDDGIPDAWATAHGLDPNDATKAQRDAGDGYTWLEHYLDGI